MKELLEVPEPCGDIYKAAAVLLPARPQDSGCGLKNLQKNRLQAKAAVSESLQVLLTIGQSRLKSQQGELVGQRIRPV
jgi:hypothetical protein